MKSERGRGDLLVSLVRDVPAWFGYFFLVLPSLIVIPMSFGSGGELSFPPKSFSLALYYQFFGDAAWTNSLVRSTKIALVTSCISTLIGFGAAYAVDRGRFPGRELVLAVLISPMLVPSIALALGLYMYFGRLGLNGTFLSLIAAHIVVTLPFVVISVISGLRQLNPNLETAAQVLGAGSFLVLRRIVAPLLMPAVVASFLFSFLISFDEIVISYFLAGPSTETLPVKMYSSIRWEISPLIAAISSILTVISIGVCLVSTFGAGKK